MISVIIPYKDAEKYILRCLKSIIAQNGDFEFIFVNDGSSDNGPKLVEEYKAIDERIIAIENEKSPGVSGARNTGIEHAAGERITFLDSDDYLLPDAWRVFKNALKLDADIIQFNHWRYYSSINKTVQKYRIGAGEYNIRRRPHCWPMVWNKLFKRELIEDVHFWPCMQYGEDELFILKCLEKSNRIKCVEGSTVVHCYGDGESLSKQVNHKKVFSLVLAIEELLFRSDDPKYRTAICDILAEHWRSETFKKIFGDR